MTHNFSYPQYTNHYQRCKKCYKLITDGKMLKDQICGAIYCPRCVCQIYRPIYLQAEEDIIIQLYCGDYVDRQLVHQHVLDNCIHCGLKFNPQKDLQMKEQVKLCRSCYDLRGKQYQHCLIQCISCGRIIRLLKYMADTEITVCKDCATQQSQLQSTITQHFKQSQATSAKQPPPNKEEFLKQPPPSRSASSISQSTSLQYQEEHDYPEDISIVSRFSALQIQEGNHQQEANQKKMKKIKMTSKHSVEIRVQNLKINFAINHQKRQKCNTCKSLISIDAIMPKKDKADVSQCRICFMESFDSRQSGLYQSFARSSVERDTNKHTSAPKTKLLGRQNENLRTMKKSMVSGDTAGSMTNLLKYTPKDLSAINNLLGWKKATVDKDRLCNICQTNQYSITRLDKKKVCRGCYSK